MPPHEARPLRLELGQLPSVAQTGLIQADEVARRKTGEIHPPRVEVSDLSAAMRAPVELILAPRLDGPMVGEPHDGELDRLVILGVRRFECSDLRSDQRQVIAEPLEMGQHASLQQNRPTTQLIGPDRHRPAHDDELRSRSAAA